MAPTIPSQLEKLSFNMAAVRSATVDDLRPNAQLTEQIFDGGFCAFFCTKGDSGNLSDAAIC